jgi:integrase
VKIQSNLFSFAPEQRANPSDTVSIKEVVGVSDRKCMQRTAGGAEVPLGEMRYLKASDIDSQRVVIRIRGGKGRKDRDVMLSPKLLDARSVYWRQLCAQCPILIPKQILR